MKNVKLKRLLMFLFIVGCLCASASGWTSTSVGFVNPYGSASYNSFTGTWTLRGDGGDIWNRTDGFHYVYKYLYGDGSITARVVSHWGTNEWSKAGVMMRETLDATSKHAMTVVTINTPGDHGLAFQWRQFTAGVSDSNHGGPQRAPYWVRIKRSGDTFVSFVSPDGISWTPQGIPVTIPMRALDGVTPGCYIGLCLTSHQYGQLATASFDNISIQYLSPGNIFNSGTVFVKWWPRFWFLNARLRLVWTPDWITIPTGYWGGWYWWHHQCHWFYPWYGPVGWWWPYCYQYPYWAYWDYWPYYRYYYPWWHYWQWRGGRWFWGFKDCLTYRYWSWRPRIVYWWGWYWDPPGGGGALQLVCQADEKNPAGPRILPFEQQGIPGFEVERHEFSVNGDKVAGMFTPLEFVQTAYLEHYYRSIPGVTDADVQEFIDSDIFKELMKNDPTGQGWVGVQSAIWEHPKATIVVDTDSIEVGEGAHYTYGVSLPERPLYPVTVNVVSSEPEEVEIMGADPDGVRQLYFDEFNWSEPQPVTIMAVDDSISEGSKVAKLAHFLSDDVTSGVPLDVTIADDECGGQGYHEADLNRDCKVNLLDLSLMADAWLTCTDPGQK